MARLHLLLAAAALGLSAGAQAARFSHTGAIQTYVVPKDGVYSILARGAAGGSLLVAGTTRIVLVNAGGSGGTAIGRFQLAAGTTLSVVVGSAGGSFINFGTGGGGGSFVFAGSTPYVIGGGGGGGGIAPNNPGQSATGIGGSGAGGFVVDPEGGAPGAGWLSDGQTFPNVGDPNAAGKSSPSFAGGSDSFWGFQTGGFGGGGSGNTSLLGLGSVTNGAGGGGGYTGGNGSFAAGGGFAGTSYVAPLALSSSFAAGRRGDGFVQIAAVPEPASWAMLIIGFGAVGGSLRARRVRPA